MIYDIEKSKETGEEKEKARDRKRKCRRHTLQYIYTYIYTYISIYTCQRGMSHARTSPVTHTNDITQTIESCHRYQGVMSRTRLSYAMHTNESCHTHERVMSRSRELLQTDLGMEWHPLCSRTGALSPPMPSTLRGVCVCVSLSFSLSFSLSLFLSPLPCPAH